MDSISGFYPLGSGSSPDKGTIFLFKPRNKKGIYTHE